MDLHTAGNAVPSLDGTDLGDALDDLTGIHAGLDLIRDGIRLLALDRHDLNTTQVLVAALAGSPDATDVIGAVGMLVARLTSPDSNPCLRTLPLDQQKETALHGEHAAFDLTNPDLRNSASNANAAIDGH
ncbi:hypothetical protein SUDANB145_07234 (plasmid) [Streptomyces sp. enrichment culture]|uniref:hypothetical protein n=1 Tax=Streptomyces sp. enrichment culture TaxID=1795815 RepID=UPI003F574E2E